MSLRRTVFSLTLAALSLAGVARAEPNITGMWAIYQPEGEDGHAIRQPRPKMTPTAAAHQAEDQKINQKYNRLIGEGHTKCLPTGMPGLMSTPFGIEFLQTKGRITILNEVSNLPRTIYMDEPKQPEDMIPGWNGHSIGHWDGDTLMVDTIGFNGRNGNVSEKMHISEKMHLDKDGYLIDEMTLDDPATFIAPYAVTYRYKRATSAEGQELMEYVCEVDPANLIAYEEEQKKEGRASTYDPAWSAASFDHPDTMANFKPLAVGASSAPAKPAEKR